MPKGMFASKKDVREIISESSALKRPMVVICDTSNEVLYSGLPINQDTINTEIKWYVAKKLALPERDRASLELDCDLFGQRIQCRHFKFRVIRNDE